MSQFGEQSSPLRPQAIASAASLVLTNVPCEAAALLGHAVRMSAGTAVRAYADDYDNANSIGVIERKITATLCDIRVLGVTPAIYAGLNETKEYFLSDTVQGEVTVVAPTVSGSVVVRIGQPYDSQRLLVIKGVRVVRS